MGTVADNTDLKVHRVYLYFFAFPLKEIFPHNFLSSKLMGFQKS